MARKLRQPLTQLQEATWQDAVRILADIHSYINPDEYNITADFNVPQFDGELFLLCTNTSSITITHTNKPKDKSHLIVVRAGSGAVSISGNGKTINGLTSQNLPSQYDVMDVQFFETLDKFIIV